MATLRKAGTNVRRNGLLHLHIAAVEGLLGEAGLFERGLHIHAEIDNIGHELRVGLRLIPASHDTEPDVHVTFFHECWNDGVERTFVSGKRVGEAGSELEARAAVMEREAEARRDKASTITGVIALNERDNI